MIRVERVLGSLQHGFAPPSPVDELWLTRWEAQRRRLRKRTRGGRDVAVALAEPAPLADGHVLYAGPDVTVVARVEAGEVVVFTLDPATDTETLAVRALRLGHVLGNQHWPVRLQRASTSADGLARCGPEALEIVVPLPLDRRVVEAVLRAHRLDGVAYHFRAAAAGETLDQPAPPAPHHDDHTYAPTAAPTAHQNDHAYSPAPRDDRARSHAAREADAPHAHDGHTHGP